MSIKNKSNRALQKRDYETYAELERVIQEMDGFVDAIIVEGVHDKKALEELGITKEIVMCSSKSYNNCVDYLRDRYRRVAILTDYDRAGKKCNKQLTARLEREGVKVDKRYRDEIGKVLGFRGMKCIEAVNALKKRIL